MPRGRKPQTFEQKLESIVEDESIDVPNPESMVMPEPVPPKTPAKRGPKPKVPKKPDEPIPAPLLVKEAPPKTKVIEIHNKKEDCPKKISLVLEF